jgi:hypothetical protein
LELIHDARNDEHKIHDARNDEHIIHDARNDEHKKENKAFKMFTQLWFHSQFDSNSPRTDGEASLESLESLKQPQQI